MGVPCPRCDPWTPEKVYTLEGGDAENVLRRVLAYQHITGGSETLIKNAAQQIQAAGSAGEFTRRAGSGQQSLYRLGHTSTMALEIALNENVEQRLMDMEVRALEFMWKKEEDLARIIDEELSPRHIFERHMRKMPPRLAAKLGQTFPSVVGASEEGGED